MVNQPRIEIAFPEVVRNEPSGRILIRTMAPVAGKTQPTANFTVRIVDPGSKKKVRGASVFVSYYIDGAEARPQQIAGSPATTNNDGCATFEYPTHPSLVHRIIMKIECNGSSLDCGLLPPAAAPAQGDGTVAHEISDLVSGAVNLDEEESAAVIAVPPLPPPPTILSEVDLLPAPAEPIPINRRTLVGVPMLAGALAVDPVNDGIVRAPEPESHIGDTMPQAIEPETHTPAAIFPESVRELDTKNHTAKDKPAHGEEAAHASLKELKENIQHVEELRLQYERSVMDAVVLQGQFSRVTERLFTLLADSDGSFSRYQADIDQETREVREVKKTCEKLLENIDAKTIALIDMISYLGPEFEKEAIQLITKLTFTLERSLETSFAKHKAELEKFSAETIDRQKKNAIKWADNFLTTVRSQLNGASSDALEMVRQTTEAQRLSLIADSEVQKKQIRFASLPPFQQPFVFEPPSPLRSWRTIGRQAAIGGAIALCAGTVIMMVIDAISRL